MRQFFAMLTLVTTILIPLLGCTGAAESTYESEPIEVEAVGSESTNTTAN